MLNERSQFKFLDNKFQYWNNKHNQELYINAVSKGWKISHNNTAVLERRFTLISNNTKLSYCHPPHWQTGILTNRFKGFQLTAIAFVSNNKSSSKSATTTLMLVTIEMSNSKFYRNGISNSASCHFGCFLNFYRISYYTLLQIVDDIFLFSMQTIFTLLVLVVSKVFFNVHSYVYVLLSLFHYFFFCGHAIALWKFRKPTTPSEPTRMTEKLNLRTQITNSPHWLWQLSACGG